MNDGTKINEIINQSISHHQTMKNYYFFTPPQRASERRNYEKRHSKYFEFDFEGHHYVYESICDCSARNVYFSDGFYIDGTKKDVRLFKKIMKKLEETETENNECKGKI